jgi:hypothetical protein
MNWLLFALVFSSVLVIAWLLQIRKGRWEWAGLYPSFACLIVACFNTAAPFRGAIDPGYVGFRFGMLHAEKGVLVSLLAGSILIASAVSAMIAASGRMGRELWIVGVTCAAMFVIVGIPTIGTMLSGASNSTIQFGEYLTIPGTFAIAIMLLLFAVPFAFGTVWGLRGALKNTVAPENNKRVVKRS